MDARWIPVMLATALVGLAACVGQAGDAGDTAEAESGRVVDSIFPMEEQIRRFQATVADTPSTFRGGAPSRDDLVDAFLDAVRARDTEALAKLVVDRGEYAFLYYPYSHFAAPPYELPPDILWFQTQNSQSRALFRLFGQMDERALDARGYRCEEDALELGPTVGWDDCFILVSGRDGDVVDLRLFGTILMHDGRYKFLSLSNEL
jgi:hypothetical protein